MMSVAFDVWLLSLLCGWPNGLELLARHCMIRGIRLAVFSAI